MKKRIEKALRGAACHDLPAQTKAELLDLAGSVSDGIDWRSVAIALCVKYGTAQGQALLGGGTMKWAREKVAFRADPDGDGLHLHWDAPPLNALPERK